MNKSHRQRNAEIRTRFEKERKANEECDAEQTPSDYKMLIAQKIEMPETEMKLRPLMEQGIIPKPLHSVVFCGGTGSGKTNTLLNWLLRRDFYKDFNRYFP